MGATVTHRSKNTKAPPHLGNRVKDSLIRRDVSGRSDEAPLSPGVGHNLQTQGGPPVISQCEGLPLIDAHAVDFLNDYQ